MKNFVQNVIAQFLTISEYGHHHMVSCIPIVQNITIALSASITFEIVN